MCWNDLPQNDRTTQSFHYWALAAGVWKYCKLAWDLCCRNCKSLAKLLASEPDRIWWNKISLHLVLCMQADCTHSGWNLLKLKSQQWERPRDAFFCSTHFFQSLRAPRGGKDKRTPNPSFQSWRAPAAQPIHLHCISCAISWSQLDDLPHSTVESWLVNLAQDHPVCPCEMGGNFQFHT